jgi:hypothetical protein
MATLVGLNRGNGELTQVKGVIIGAMNIQEVMRPAGPLVTVKVQFETNYSEVRQVDGKKVEATYYCVENWKFTRRADALSPEPDEVRSVGCPSCGSSLELKPDGSCQHCGETVRPGDHHWSVRHIQIVKRLKRGPHLTADVPEVGTDRKTVMDPLFKQHRATFEQEHEGFDWEKANERFRHVFYALQNAWTNQDWQKSRPYETDSLFQNHLFWMRQYAQQNLHNALEKIEMGRIEPVKIRSDRFYDAITCRVYASMIDYTTDKGGKLLCGSKGKPRSFSEYWTFIRGRGIGGHDRSDDQCPSCGAGLKINMAGRCEYCNSKITTGKFDWVLSTIEQDESYSG